MTPRRLLMIAYYFPPLGMGGVQRPLKFAKYLPEFGWDVTVITSNITDYHAIDESLLLDIPSSVDVVRVDSIDPAVIVRRRREAAQTTSSSPQSGLLKHAQQWSRWPDDKLHFARVAAKQAQHIAAKTTFDAVYTTSPPPSVHYAGLTLQDKLGIPWVSDFRDPWLVRADDWGPTSIHRRYSQRLRDRIISRANHVVAMNPLVADELVGVQDPGSVSIISNGFDEEDFSGVPSDRDDSRFTFAFYGTLTDDTPLLPFIQAASEWQHQHPEKAINIEHIGAAIGDAFEKLRVMIPEGLSFTSTGYLNHRDAIARLCRADAAVLSISEDSGFRMTIPGRAYEVLRSLRPILVYAPKDSALGQLMASSEETWMCDVGVPETTRAALDQLMARVVGEPARSIESLSRYARHHQSSQLAAILDTLASRASANEAK